MSEASQRLWLPAENDAVIMIQAVGVVAVDNLEDSSIRSERMWCNKSGDPFGREDDTVDPTGLQTPVMDEGPSGLDAKLRGFFSETLRVLERGRLLLAQRRGQHQLGLSLNVQLVMCHLPPDCHSCNR